MHFYNERERTAMAVSAASIALNLFLAAGKLTAGFFCRSTALITDGVHSASDILSTLILMVGVRLSSRPADKEHPYGHERIECLAAAALALVLAAAACAIGWQGYLKIEAAQYAAPPALSAAFAAVISIAAKELMYRYTAKAARKIDSGALMADAWHHRSDALSSVGAFVGIIGARCGLPVFDPLASIVICLMILYQAWEIFMDAADRLLDRSCDDATCRALWAAADGISGVEHVDSLRTRMFANRIYVDIEISVRDELNLAAAHVIAENVHRSVEKVEPLVKHCMVHVNPLSEKTHACPGCD